MTAQDTQIPEDISRAAVKHVLDSSLCVPRTNAVIDVIARAILAERQRNQWQDISSAPRDGTEVLCFSPGNPRAFSEGAKEPQWRVDYVHSKHGTFYKMWPEAPYTHWQPLSSSPKGGEA